MNQTEESNDNSPPIKVGTVAPENNLETTEVEVSAVAQIVDDISASPAEILKSAFPVAPNEENGESAQIDETQVDKTPTKNQSPVISETGVLQLENAMVGKSYCAEIDLNELKIEASVLYPNFGEQAKTLGLTAERENNILRIAGKPAAETAGEHILFLDYTYDEQRIHRKRIVLLINPDPKSLWKNLEPDADLPYRKEHTATEQIFNDDFRIIAASRRGRSHAHEGKFREDDFAVSIAENDWHILIVTDGAGSARLSRRGSRLACQTAHEFLGRSIAATLEPKFDKLMRELGGAETETTEKELKNILYQVLCGAAFAAYKRLETESAETGNALKDYSATLLMSLVKKHEQQIFVAAFGIGDGAIGVYDEASETVELMNSPDGGEFSGQTRFLTMREVVGDGAEMLRRVKFKLFDKFTILALMTDGISDPKFGTDKNLESAAEWNKFGGELAAEIDFNPGNEKAAVQLLDYMDFWSAGEHDDRTLAILY